MSISEVNFLYIFLLTVWLITACLRSTVNSVGDIPNEFQEIDVLTDHRMWKDSTVSHDVRSRSSKSAC